MRSVSFLVLAGFVVASVDVGWGEAGPRGLVAYWRFDGDLADASGRGHEASLAGAAFVEGKVGQALRLSRKSATVADSEDLHLEPGLTLDCWVYFDEPPGKYQEQLVRKDGEYLLRVDSLREGLKFSFFVYLGGWEPRVSVASPKAKTWYHVIARWTGTEAVLEVNGERATGRREGTPRPTDRPVEIGPASCRLDELRIANPNLLRRQRMMKMIAAVPDARRFAGPALGGPGQWAVWQGLDGATVRQASASTSAQPGALLVHVPDNQAMVVNPAVSLSTAHNTFVSLDARASRTGTALLTFITDAGFGVARVPVWNFRRTSVVNLAGHTAWRGQLKLLALSWPGEEGTDLVLHHLYVADEPKGPPFVYVRNLAPKHAILRVGRKEKLIAVVRNLGSSVSSVQVKLAPPRGAHVLDGAERTIEALPFHGLERVEWTLRADRPTAGRAQVTLWVPGGTGRGRSVALRFRPKLNLPRADYVPRPHPVRPQYLTLMHYCPLWKEGTHYGWERIEDWPERRPAIGWYDEGTPVVTDWQIKYALEHGIQGFIYCWYRADFSPEIHQLLGHAIHDGLFKARYRDMFKFAIMWENGCAKGVKSADDMLDNLLPFWIDNYFKHPSYVKLDNKPLLFVWRPERVAPEVGGSGAVKAMFAKMRQRCREEGFDGLYIIGCVDAPNEGLLTRMAAEGWDATTAYGIYSPAAKPPTIDLEGFVAYDYKSSMEGQIQTWLAKKATGALPDIIDVMVGWDPRPWHGPNTRGYRANPSPEIFRWACRRAKELIESTPGHGLDKRLVVFDNWDEFGEGHYIEPCAGYGFSFVDAIRDVFCPNAGPHEDVIPEDVGLEPPEHAYLMRRRLLGIGQRKVRRVVDHLLAWWSFDEDEDYVARDKSACGFVAVKDRYESAPGVVGKAFKAGRGSLTLRAEELLYSSTGITIEAWIKVAQPRQSDRWILNAVTRANTGYRLGLLGGKLAWQVPDTPWSHLLTSPEPVPVGRWLHVAATHDNEKMRLYINGRQVGELDRPGAIRPAEGQLCIGAFGQGDPSHAFIGLIDELKLYDRALTPEEIQAHWREYAGASTGEAAR
ncbi:MAG: glycoside hydrolase family 99-like domain-containing protein [Armatimonadetes bacterium]|nr:glycoside hydrolase family 99-like domain-containing protein [Armatimonadota bacterium]